MDPSKKLEFVHRMTRLALEKVPHFDAGGAVNPNTGIAGTVGGALGLNNNFQAGAANTTAGTNAQQLGTSYNQAQTGLAGLQDIASTTAGNVGNATLAQQGLAAQLGNEAAGRGPNPAQAALNQNTGQNVATTAALIAGQRGAGANPGLAALNAAQTGASAEQQAVGQAATLQAQQQLAAQQNLANLSANQISQGLGAAQTSANASQNEQNILQQANTAFNNAQVGMQSNINNVNAQTAAGNQGMAGQLIGGIAGGASSALSAIGLAKGGLVRMDKGGHVLDAEHRNRLHKDSFALPGRRYPIHDTAHARNALARVSQYGTPAEKAKVRAAVHKKYPEMGAKKMADGGSVSDGPQVQEPGIAQVPQPGAFPVQATDTSTLNIPATPAAPAKGGGGANALASLAPIIAAAMADGGTVEPTPEQKETEADNVKAAGEAYDKLHGTYKQPQAPTLDPRTWMANGGSVMPGYAGGGFATTVSAPSISGGGVKSPQSFVGQWVNTPAQNTSGPSVAATPSMTVPGGSDLKQGITAGLNSLKPTDDGSHTQTDEEALQGYRAADAALGGDNPEAAYSGQDTFSPEMSAAAGGLAAHGGSVEADNKAQKAVTQKDSLKNDKIPAMLSEGEGVIDKETMNDPGPLGQMARALIKHIEAKKKGGKNATQAR